MIIKTLETSSIDSSNKTTRIAMLFQGAGHYWQPILSEFTKLFPQTRVFTPFRPGFMPDLKYGIKVVPVGQMKVITRDKAAKGYSPSFTYLSPAIVGHLWKYRPEVIFSTAFSLWTLVASILKIFFRWRTVIVFDGSSPGVDHTDSRLRSLVRRMIIQLTDAFITNTKAGQEYLTEIIGAPESSIFVRPYLIPHPQTYSQHDSNLQLGDQEYQRPRFIFAGKLIPRKGLLELLRACSLMQTRGYEDYTLLVVGDGIQRQELEEFVSVHNLENQVKFIGKVAYEQMGNYYQQADVFVFPTLEDVWGLVAVEAMMFGKPLLCSKWAGAAEMVADGENGYIIDPFETERLAESMINFINCPDLITSMGEKSRQIMTNHKPESVSKFLAEVVNFVQTK